VALGEDQHAVGELGSDGADDPFGVAVGLRTSGRDLDDPDAGIDEDGVESCSELACAVADQEPELGCVVTEVAYEVAGLLGSPWSVGVGGGAEDVNVAGVDLDHEQHVDSTAPSPCNGPTWAYQRIQGFCLANWTINSTISESMGGRPVRCGAGKSISS